MIAAIPAEDRPTIISIEVPGQLFTGNIKVSGIVLHSLPLTCLSCGAKTNTAGELPCGH
ncbi:hypothetical protein ACIPEN_22320 [Herbaspirillum chlorophenolicum]|uniref:Uncharacterized protein n=1 Tax=Herbaspirillum chlorophenolicum TaxID=211589 RepID=A0ABW8F5K0_9BURK